MDKVTKFRVMIILMAVFILGSSTVFAKEHGGGNHGWKGGDNPEGWSHGEKTGWHGEDMPPGLEKKEEHKGKEKREHKHQGKKEHKKHEHEEKDKD